VDRALPAGARHDLTDEQWAILAPLLPVGRQPGPAAPLDTAATHRRYPLSHPHRLPVARHAGAVRHRAEHLRAVSPLAADRHLGGDPDRPAGNGRRGGLHRVGGVGDSTINRAHQHAAGARRHPEDQAELPLGEPADHALGRSRGGLSTKVHPACEQRRKTLATTLTAGQAADSPQFTAALGRIRVPRRSGPGRLRTRPDRVLGDKAHSSRANRTDLRRRGIPATIPIKAGQQAHRRSAGAHRTARGFAGGFPGPGAGRAASEVTPQ
jgi:transposase